MITLEEAKNLKYGEILLDTEGHRWKVNGQVKTWKRDSRRIYVPLKYGFYTYSSITERDFLGGECHTLTKED